MMMSSNDITNAEILEALHAFSTAVDTQFKSIDTRFKSIDIQFKEIKAVMVTKDYLDEKLADLRGDITIMMRKEDVKLKTLVTILEKRKIISSDDVRYISSLEPFPQLAL